ncbi:MAG: Dihydroorotate dehydrogenase (quinone), mitochondrial [Candelina submexicana]|nr:MAG: Dihydroorotate dehydrogenase (quinone), mitochondrial [Candelina submexicana]
MLLRHALTCSSVIRPWYRSIAHFPTRSLALLPFKSSSQKLALTQGLRYASTAREIATDSGSLITRLKNLLLGTSIALALTFGYYYVTDTRAGIHQWVVVPSLRWFYDDAEDAHEAGTRALKALHSFGIHPRERGSPDKAGDLQVEVFGCNLSNPIGTSAGIDKHADVPSPLLALGPSIVEIGGATPYPQEGNPKPRVFRLPSQNALINRYGLNSEGADFVAMRLRQRLREFAYTEGFGIDNTAEQRVLDGEAGVPPGSLAEGKLLAVQIAKNMFTLDDDIDAVKADYVYCVDQLAKYADIIVVNVSSPNTPGLRGLQKVEPLTNILKGVVLAAKATDRKTKPAVMVKVSPDEDTDEQVSGVCEAVWESGVDGVIVGNTTKRRPDPLPPGYKVSNKEAAVLLEQGGYSGPQLFERTVSLVKEYRRLLDEGPLDQAGNVSGADEVLDPVSGPKPADNAEASLLSKIEDGVKRDAEVLKKSLQTTSGAQQDEAFKSQPLIQLPERNSLFSSGPNTESKTTPLSASHHLDDPSAQPEDEKTLGKKHATPKVIFATGGITNGAQALEVLKAGASVAMIYTALVYGGVGTISRIKAEMRDKMKQKKA